VKRIIGLLLLAGMLFTVGFSSVGCSKKEEPKKPAATPDKKADEKPADKKP
jgi:hypothetical protein